MVAAFAPALIETLLRRETTMGADSTRAPDGATVLTKDKPDADILAAWGRRSAACAIYGTLPFSECPKTQYTPEEQTQIDAMDTAEIQICKATSSTPQGVAVQLWTALAHIEQTREAETAINIMDLDWFFIDETQFDWSVRLILAALRSLRAMGGAS
ncbi:hypothetical protein ACIPPQ_20060 [Sphingopyxis sp. LARHCG72]